MDVQQIVKVCKKHGGLAQENIWVDNRGSKRCRLCRKLTEKKAQQSEKRKEYQRRYRQSDKYKESKIKFQQSEKYKEYVRKYYKCEKVKERVIKYTQSEKRKEYERKYRQSNKHKESQVKYRQSEKCKELKRKFQNNLAKKIADSYIKKILKQQSVSNENITPEYIRIKRLFLKANRLIKQEKKTC